MSTALAILALSPAVSGSRQRRPCSCTVKLRTFCSSMPVYFISGQFTRLRRERCTTSRHFFSASRPFEITSRVDSVLIHFWGRGTSEARSADFPSALTFVTGRGPGKAWRVYTSTEDGFCVSDGNFLWDAELGCFSIFFRFVQICVG